jgi:DNA-binding response OmpR family regulator/DNA-binding CsgD family transcriptional regulator
MNGQDRDLIMIVDDDPEACTILTKALSQAGFSALSAADGASALALIDQTRPSLVVLDAIMAGISGFETCRRLKQHADHAHLPVIFITGLTETEHVVEGLRAGGVDYVTKPIVLEELIARIRVHLATARLAHSAQVALDVAGRSLLAVDSKGRPLWRTPQAAELLVRFSLLEGGEINGLSQKIVTPILDLIARCDEANLSPAQIDVEGRALELRYLGRTGQDEFYFRLNAPTNESEADVLKAALVLTARESEVLVWTARGKANRDISEILNISPRTVNKHLEQIFAKLGVENRAAAAAIATRIVTARN